MKRVLAVAAVLTALVTPATASADWKDTILPLITGHKEVVPVDDPAYEEECGACHFAFQPGLLPARSWAKLMTRDALADHFGDNAELEEPLRAKLAAYLAENAADKTWRKRAIKIRRSIPEGEAPLRISEVPYIERAHHDLGDRHVKDNDKVKSMANCDACHTKAAEGVYDDDTVLVPGFGRNWE